MSRESIQARILGLASTGLVAVASLGATPALALWDGKLTPFVEGKVTRDDNVFRVSKNSDPAGDSYRTISLGFNLDAPVSRQRFQAGYTWSAMRFNRFTDLDFDGHDTRATWLWQLGNDLSGQLGYAENFALAPFAYTQSSTPDPLRSRQAALSAAYLVTPRWRLQAGAAAFSQTNGASQFESNDININSADASLSYVTPSNTSIGLSERIEEGRYPNRDFGAGIGTPFDDSYRQFSRGITADWTISGVSRVAVRASHVNRRYPHTPQNDFDGNTAVAEFDWKPTGKLSLAGIVRRDISPYQAIQSSFVLVKGGTLRATLSLTQKVEVSGTVDYSVWYYLGDPGLTGGVEGRVDHVGSGALALSYKPLQEITLQLSVLRESRSSSAVNADYLANVASFSARVAF